jgi:2'-5' RNA ligase
VRIFLAVHVGEQLRRELSARLDPWRRRLAVRWTRPSTWHVTLQFLGDWPPRRQESLLAALPDAGATAPFTLRPTGPGAFPDRRRPRVLFLHLDGDGRDAELAGHLRDIVARTWPEGPQDTRPYRSHLTLARIRKPLDRKEVKILDDIDLSGLPEFSVEGFSLVGSELRPEGSRYRDLGFWRLRKKGE